MTRSLRRHRRTPTTDEETYVTATIPTAPTLAVAVFDVELDGGSTGQHPLRGDLVPAGAIVVDALLRVDAPFVIAGSARTLATRELPTAELLIGQTQALPPTTLGNSAWSAGRVRRAALTAEARTVTVTVDSPLLLGIAPTGGVGFFAGALTAVVTYLLVP